MKARIKQSIKWILIGRQSQFAASLVFQLIIMRILSPEDYGFYALALSSLGFIAMFVSFGFSYSIIQFRQVEGIERNVLGVSLLQSLAYVILAIPGFFVVEKVYGNQVSRIYLLLILPQAIALLSPVFQFAIERDLDFRKTEIILLTSKLISVLSCLGLALAGFGVYSLVVGFAVRVVLEGAIFWKYCHWSYGIGWDRDIIRTVVVYGSKRFFARGCGTMMGYLDKLILGLLVPVALVGGYERGLFIISSALGLVSQIDSRFAFSLINRIKEDSRRLISLINKATFIAVSLASALALVSIFWLQDLIIFFLGNQWVETARLIPYFALYLVAVIPAVFIRQVFYAEKDPLHIVWGRLMEIGAFLLLAWGIYRLTGGEDYFIPLVLMALNLGFSTLVGVGYLVAILLRMRQLRADSLGRPLLLAGVAALGGCTLRLSTDLPSSAVLLVSGIIYGALLWRFCRAEFLWFRQFWQS